MKKSVLLLAILATLGVATSVAQPRAVGGQLGYLIEASYEHTLGNNFLSIDLGFPGWFVGGFGIETVATYNWLNPFGADFPTIEKGDWNWYMGAGLGLGDFISANRSFDSGAGMTIKTVDNSFYLGAAGRFGVEYNFWFPLQLSVEWRPLIGPSIASYSQTYEPSGTIVNKGSGVGFNREALYATAFILGVRYKF